MKSPLKKSVHARTLTFLTTTVLLLSLVGCSNTDDASPDLEETTDASASDSKEFVPASEEGPAQNVPKPRLPAATTEYSDEGAQTALEFFWKAESYASLTGDSGPLSTVSSEDCDFCNESIEGWPQSYDDGYWSVLDGEIEVDVTDVLMAEEENEAQNVAHVYFKLTEPPTDFYDSEGVRMDGSFSSSEATGWVSELTYDATAQAWYVEWVGLEADIVWDEP